ncbi:MAG: hypothetical protein VKM01_01700 [Cyanobacteriota bacterium]|nr:hypothetical protein [Cyanobacteriota bacterium]
MAEWHSIGYSQLGYLLHEGAVAITRDWFYIRMNGLAELLVIGPLERSRGQLQSALPRDTLLICLGPWWTPDRHLAQWLCGLGYFNVYTMAHQPVHKIRPFYDKSGQP